jgi:proline dehydrogenase
MSQSIFIEPPSSTPARLKNYLAHATSNGYTLGVKLVRGAYHPLETEHHNKNPANKGTLPPVWSEKSETDECYNRCVTMLLDQVSSPDSRSTPNKAPAVGLLFGTHNKDSCEVIMNGLVDRSLAARDENTGVLTMPQWVSGQVQIGQLYGRLTLFSD